MREEQVSDQARTIKKYPNRRLYDTHTSSYITLADVKDLVMSFEEFKVIDAKSGDDLTRSILLQIILEEETANVPLFSTELLAQMIRFYGHAMQGMLGKYLENNIRTFVDFQAKMQPQSRPLSAGDAQMQNELWAQFLNFQGPAMQTMMSSYMEQSRKMVEQLQEQMESQTRNMFTGFNYPAGSEPKNPGKE